VVLRAAWPQGKVSTVALGIALGKLRRATLDGPG